MITDYQILIEKYYWDSQTPLKDINFFSDASKTLVETIDLKDYLINIDKIKFDNENIEDKRGYNYFYFVDSDIKISLKGNLNNNYLINFFDINKEDDYVKYLLKIYKVNNNELIYTGIINPEAIKQSFTRYKGNKVIDVLALGMLKEFKNYYSQKPLLGQQFFNWIFDTSSIAPPSYAYGYLYFNSYPYAIMANDYVIAGEDTYIFKTNPTQSYEVQIGLSPLSNCYNLRDKINELSNTVNASFTGNYISPELKITAKVSGEIGNTYPLRVYCNTGGIRGEEGSSGYLRGGSSGVNVKYNHRILFKDLLSQLINIPIVLDSEIEEHYVMRDCILKKIDTYSKNYFLVKTGYERITQTGEHVWGFIEKLCMSRGYISFVINGTFYIHNRSNTNSISERVIDCNKLLSPLNLSKENKKGDYEAIMLYDGEFYGGAGAGFGDIRRGDRIYLFTEKIKNPKNNIPFALMSGSFGLQFWNNEWNKILTSEKERTRIGLYNDYQGGYGYELQTIDTDKILFFDAGDTKEYGFVYDTANGNSRNHTRNGDVGIGNTVIYFKGNYGNCLVKFVNGKYYLYQDYMQSEMAENNFNSFLKSFNKRCLSLTVKEAIFNPLFYVKFTNIPDNLAYVLDGNWKNISMQVDLIHNTTNLELNKIK